MPQRKSWALKVIALLLAGGFLVFGSGCIVVPDGYGYHGYRGYHGHHRHDRHHGYDRDDDDGYRIRKY